MELPKEMFDKIAQYLKLSDVIEGLVNDFIDGANSNIIGQDLELTDMVVLPVGIIGESSEESNIDSDA